MYRAGFCLIFLVVGLEMMDCELSRIPPANKGALMARYIVHNSDYTSIASISSINKIRGYPFVSITSISDGPVDNSTGNPYMYLPSIDYTAKDLSLDNRVSLLMSLIQGDFCKEKDLDPEDPRCAHVMMTGKFIKLPKNTAEYSFAQKTLFERHPVMHTWPANHNFFFAKMEIQQIAVQDMFGGPLLVTSKEYFAVDPNEVLAYDSYVQNYYGYDIQQLK